MDFESEGGKRYTGDGPPRMGGQAEVYACCAPDGRRVAVKWARANADPKWFARERQYLDALQGQADSAAWTMPLLDAGERDGRGFLVLPWIEEDLERWLQGDRTLEERLRAAALRGTTLSIATRPIERLSADSVAEYKLEVAALALQLRGSR